MLLLNNIATMRKFSIFTYELCDTYNYHENINIFDDNLCG